MSEVFFTRTKRMFVRTITLTIENAAKAGSQICNYPRFLDGKPASLPCDATRLYIHPSKSTDLKPYFSRKQATFELVQYLQPHDHSINIATLWGMARQAISSSLLHSFLNSVQCPLILLASRTAPVHIHMNPRSSPSTGTREPKCLFSAKQNFTTCV